MTTIEKFQEVAKINFVEYGGDIEISEWLTADGYEMHVITQDPNNIQFDSEAYYYKPEFDTIMEEIDNARNHNQYIDVLCLDLEEYFDEYYLLDYLQDNMDEDEFDEFTNE